VSAVRLDCPECGVTTHVFIPTRLEAELGLWADDELEPTDAVLDAFTKNEAGQVDLIRRAASVRGELVVEAAGSSYTCGRCGREVPWRELVDGGA
jgi:predicted RNA-binding Zn-ribbon protein involved in translation (DUF1610 family)